ncbi:MAG TPA: O-antigen ligase family protein [Flavipsychrobacter sp.]|nr:O-antigen ligase family protein [Flavipsychrobacter sp.]
MDSVRLQSDYGSGKQGWRHRLVPDMLARKLGHPLVLLITLLTCLCFAGFITFAGPKYAILGLVLMLGMLVAAGVVVNPRFGILTMLVAAYLIMWIMRLGVNFPLGTLMDGLQGLLILGFLLKIRSRRDWYVFKNPISYLILIWIGYNLLQIANPAAESRLAWLYTLRSVAILMLMYFIFFYHIRSTEFVKQIFKLWILLSTFAAAYGMYQEMFGYLPFEQRWIDSDPLITDLYFIAGHWRKFSIFSDPVAFAYNMVMSSILCFCIATGPVAIWKKIILNLLGAFYIMVMLYSGTRGAYVLLPAAMFMYSIMRFNKKVFVFAMIVAMIMAVLIVIPTGNPTIVRFQSAFKPAEDASFNLRSQNQKKIQPYILSHPMGGGLGATGVWGQRFAPGSYLASFPPDSGYVRVAVELGWMGLLIFCILMFAILRTGIKNYYRIRSPELKTYCLAITLILFVLNIGNYPQEALVQFPSNIYFYLAIALVNVFPIIDKQLHGGTAAS